MRKLFILLVGIVFLVFAGLAGSTENDFGVAAMSERKEGESLLDQYRRNIEYSWFMCTAARMAGGGLPEYIKAHKVALKKQYETAVKTVKKPAAKTALKEHLVQAFSLIEGVEPGMNETRIDYDRRQTENKEKLKKAWIRFELE